jgi:hypothetical protein
MLRLWKEIQYFRGQVRGDYRRQREEEKFWELIRPLMSIELKPYTYIECLTTAYVSGITQHRIAEVGGLLFARSNRGTADMKEVREILSQWPKRYIYE